MKLEDLVGRTIIEVWVDHHCDQGLESSASFLLLDNDILIDFPLFWNKGDDDLEGVKSTELDNSARELRSWVREENYWVENPNDLSVNPLPIRGVIRHKVINQRIANVITLSGRGVLDEKGALVLENGVVITQELMGMQGTGAAGLWYFDSIKLAEERFGICERRLIDQSKAI